MSATRLDLDAGPGRDGKRRAHVRQLIEVGFGAPIERVTAFVRGAPFEAHRHEGFIIGVTTAGVQHFTYRDRRWSAPAGQAFLLFPDEAHDGYGKGEGFGYAAAYIDPILLQIVLGGRSLPSPTEPLIVLDVRQRQALAPLWTGDALPEQGEIAEAVVALAELLGAGEAARPLPMAALARTRDFIRASPRRRLSLSTLERVSGLDRWSLARQFRQAFGVSPTRYRTMRQLALARSLITAGESLAAAAADAGFADQSHMSRKFRSAFGITPGRWRAATDLRHKHSI